MNTPMVRLKMHKFSDEEEQFLEFCIPRHLVPSSIEQRFASLLAILYTGGKLGLSDIQEIQEFYKLELR